MPPVPLYPQHPTPNTDGHHRWWFWNGREIDVKNAKLPRIAHAAILAHRDAVTAEEQDAAFYLVTVVEEHPPWDGGCPACRTPTACPEQVAAEPVAFDFVWHKTLQLRDRLLAGLTAQEAKYADTLRSHP